MRTRYKYKKLKLAWLKLWFFIALILPSTVVSASQFSELLSQLSEGGYVLYIRHAATRHDIADQEPLQLNDCTTQRNLTPEGRAYSKRLGALFSDYPLPYSQVIASPFCRTRDTAQLAFKRVVLEEFLFFSAGLNQKDRNRLSQKLRSYLNQKPEPGQNNIVVGHTSNLREAVGKWPDSEGVIHIFKPQAGLLPLHVGVIKPEQINQWYTSR